MWMESTFCLQMRAITEKCLSKTKSKTKIIFRGNFHCDVP